MKNNRRDFIKTTLATAGAVALGGMTQAFAGKKEDRLITEPEMTSELPSFKTPGCMEGMPIHATFLDEVSWDIPHANWSPEQWDRDFGHMKAMGINTVVLIRAGLAKWIAAPFESLIGKEAVMYPPVDLVEMFLTLADKHGMRFFFGFYDSGYYWHVGNFQREVDLNRALIDEVWAKYGHHKSFQGWYMSQEVSRRTRNVSKIYADLGRHAKDISGGLTTMVSPYIHGVKTDQVMGGDKATTVEEHEKEWDDILGNLEGVLDILAFQDGQVEYEELFDYLCVNKMLSDRHGMHCWTNVESFDRDMPIRFLPIKFEKLLMKLDCARRAGMEDVITFEFSHFMSPQSIYASAGNLYNLYCRHFGIKV